MQNQKKKPDTCQVSFPEIEIPRLMEELFNFNGQKYHQLQPLLENVYNTLFEFYLTRNKQVTQIENTPNLQEKDLIALCQGVRNTFSYYPRPVQLISVILLFNHSQNKGRLAQIYTGEGKTLIVAMLAVLLAIKKQSVVDIITSSPVLAKRDAEELVKFYEYFKLTVSHNIGDQQKADEKNMLICYKANIVYGDAHSFEGDILRHEYSEQGTKGNRQQGYAIVDEVDSMLIDGSDHQTYISSPIPGMLDITKILRLIWSEICKSEKNIFIDNQSVPQFVITNNNQTYYVELQEHLCKTLNFQIQEEIGKLMLPYRLDYINFMKETWIKKAILAKYSLKENQDYVIDNKQIRIVDYQNTGVIHSHNMQWSQGLHQFVQLKHDLNISPLSICTNFMSNVCFFKRYKNQLLGLTGTLGSKYTKQLLANQYNVDFILVPPNKPRLLQELPGKATPNQDEWLEEIRKDAYEQINQNRAVLIINESIQDVQSIQQNYRNQNVGVTLYTDDSQEINKKIKEREVIIATNLAGRGTDFITNEVVENNGGLHVIVTFLPKNIRIQEQAFGRTGRQGRKGTARLIVQTDNSEDSILIYERLEKFNLQYNLLNILKKNRDENEEKLMNEKDQQMNKLMAEDECFQEFCAIAKASVNPKQQPALFKNLEEQWGFYIEKNKKMGLKKEDINSVVIQKMNPKYLVLQGLHQNDESFINEAANNSQSDPAVIYYQGCFQLKKLSKSHTESATQTLQRAKELFQEKIDNENGFYLAERINKQLISQFQQKSDKESSELQNESDHLRRSLAFEPLYENFPKEQPQILQQQFINEDNNFHPQNLRRNQNINIDNFLRENENENLFQDMHIDRINAIPQHQDNEQVEQNQQFNQDQLIQNKRNQNESSQVDKKVQNQIKVYQSFIKNIDELISTVRNYESQKEELKFGWTSTLKNSKNKEMMKNQDQKDKQEVIEDGPLPKMGKLTKKKKESNLGSCFLMFLIGMLEVTAGILICACSAGAAYPIGKWLIQEGVKDIGYAITSALKGENIDWGQWGQQKVLSFCATLALAGSIAIKEAFSIVGKHYKTIKTISMFNLLTSNLQKVGVANLRKAGVWLTNMEKENLQNQYDTIRLIASQAEQINNSQEILSMAQYILREQIKNKIISEATAKEIEELVQSALIETQESAIPFQNILCKFCGKFLNLQMAKCKSNQSEQSQRKSVKEIFNKNENRIQSGLRSQVIYFKQRDQEIKKEICNLQGCLINSINRDQQIQLILFELDFYFQLQGQQFQSLDIQQDFEIYFSENCQISQDSALANLQINNQKAIDNFYQQYVKQILLDFLTELKQSWKITGPINILLDSELKKQMNNLQQELKLKANQLKLKQESLKRIRNPFQFEQMLQNLKIDENLQNTQEQTFKLLSQNHELIQSQLLKVNVQGIVEGDSISFPYSTVDKLNKELILSLYPDSIKKILQLTIQNALNSAKTMRRQQKIISNPFINAISQTLIKEIENTIYEKKIQAIDQKIQKYKY